MKKLLLVFLTLILTMSLALTFTSCGDDTCEVHTDENADTLCDNCGAVFIDYGKPTVIGTILKDSLEKQFSETKSVKIELDADIIQEMDEWYYTTETKDGADVNSAKNEKEYHRAVADLDIWLTKNDDSFDVKITLRGTESDEKGAEPEFAIEETVYIIDGYVYNEESEGLFIKEQLIPDEVSEILEKLAGANVLPEEKQDEMLIALGAEIATVFNIKDNKGSASIDAKPIVDNLFAYIEKLDVEKDTVSKVADDALALISADLTSAALVNELERISGLTVNEAMAELDAWLTKEHGTTIQGIYDSLVSNPEVIAVIEQAIAASKGADLTDPEIREDMDAIIAEIKAIKIADIIAENEIGDVPLYDIIAPAVVSAMSDGESTEYPTKDELFGMVREILGMTLAEFEENMGAPVFTTAKQITAGITVNKLNARLDLNFTGMLTLASIDGALNVDVENRAPSQVEGKENYTRITATATLKVSEISTTPVDVALPGGTEVADEALIENYFFANEGTIETYYWYDSGNDMVVSIRTDIYDNVSKKYVNIQANFYYEDIKADVITTDAFFIYSADGESLEIVDGSVFSFTLNPEDQSFTIVEMPKIKMPPDVFLAIQGFANNSIREFDGYTLDSLINQIRCFSDNQYDILFAEEHNGLESVTFTIECNEETGMLDCTITSFTVDSNHPVVFPETGGVWYGGCGDAAEINTYFGGNTTFSLRIDENGVFTFDGEIPCILEEYQNDWPTV